MAAAEDVENLNPAADDVEAWRAKFVDYYQQNAPTKVKMVSDAMMEKWAGKFDTLYKNLEKKYGPLGAPIAQPLKPPPALSNKAFGGRGGLGGGGRPAKPEVGDYADEFLALVAKETPELGPRPETVDVVQAKAANSENGLETSSFTVTARIRPMLAHEVGKGGEHFTAIVPGLRSVGKGDEHSEEALVLQPKVSMMGKPTLAVTAHKFDYVFGPESTNEEIFHLCGAPLVERALNGQVGVVFAYGQTGSGKTHTMNGFMDGLLFASRLFQPGRNEIKFSYIEILGPSINDCLVRPEDRPQADKGPGGHGAHGPSKLPQIGEALDGRVMTRNISEVVCSTPEELARMVEVAKSHRTTAATERNHASSRSHGVATITVTDVNTRIEGRLYIIDLAGSERSADSKNHDKARMAETKAINQSLMALKECIRARTVASRPGGGAEAHVPYRRSKLTLLMKDVFDVGCARLCSTVVLAACSPLALDVAHSANTLKYAAPLRVAALLRRSPQTKALELDVNDPALWSHDQIATWVRETAAAPARGGAGGGGGGGGVVLDGDAFTAGMSGVQVCALPEIEFYRRAETLLAGTGMLPVDVKALAKSIYTALWALIVDAKTRKRRPNGKIITPEEEEAERAALEAETAAKAALWAEREKHLRSDTGGVVPGRGGN